MEKMTLTPSWVEECVRKAAAALAAGEVIVYPTDTLYGLGADALSDEAVKKVYEIKGRDEKKPIHCVVRDLEMAEAFADVGNDARLLAQEFLPGPLTLVLKKKPNVQTGIGKGIDTIGIRIPKNDFCTMLAREFGRPFTTTSANFAGAPPVFSIRDIEAQLGTSAEGISLAIDAGTLPQREPSTVVDLAGEEPLIVREGAIPVADMWQVLQSERE